MSANKIAGIVLAGGKSRRMGKGRDKAFCRLGGETLLARAYRRLCEQTAPVALNIAGGVTPALWGAHEHPEHPEHPKPPLCLSDPIEGHVGPLGGLLAGLVWARKEGMDWLVSVAVDTPFFPHDLTARLFAQAMTKKVPIVLAATRSEAVEKEGGFSRHPTFGIWSSALCDDLSEALQKNTRKVVAWSDTHSRESTLFEGIALQGMEVNPFFNINTPEDLAKAETFHAALEGQGAL